ncbi:MAG: hypothetical protein II867_04325, partial [Clostridia bacterium]|nr:hypothetical protein [Clostridia bacterium]
MFCEIFFETIAQKTKKNIFDIFYFFTILDSSQSLCDTYLYYLFFYNAYEKHSERKTTEYARRLPHADVKVFDWQ